MKIDNRTWLAGSALIGLLLAASACGTEQVADTDPGSQPHVQSREYPPIDVPVWTPGPKLRPTSPDAVEHRADAIKKRDAFASKVRLGRDGHQESRLSQAGQSSRT